MYIYIVYFYNSFRQTSMNTMKSFKSNMIFHQPVGGTMIKAKDLWEVPMKKTGNLTQFFSAWKQGMGGIKYQAEIQNARSKPFWGKSD